MAETRRWPIHIVGHGEVDPRTLVPHPWNPKIHTAEQDAVVEASLRRLGWVKSVIVNETTGRLLDGHERVELALLRDEATVPVEYVAVPEADEGAVLRILDPSGQLAKTHIERWAALHQDAAGADEPVLKAFWGKLAQQYRVASDAPAWQGSFPTDVETQEAEVLEAAEALRRTWDVEVGQTWQVGRHRIQCGDSRDPDVIRGLAAAQAVALVVTSPPYAVDKAYEAGDGVETHRALLRALGAVCTQVVVPGGFVVLNFAEVWAQTLAAPWTGRTRACVYPMSVEYWQTYHGQYGWDLYAARIWVKPFAKLRQPLWTYHTSLAHQQEWEHVWTWRVPGGAGEQVYDWDASSRAVWDSRVDWQDADGGPWAHWSAGFPVFVPRQVLRAHSAKGAVVWDPFLGGGTTLLACEELGRVCLGTDRDPRAIAVTLQRFVDAGGARPRRLG